MCEGRHFLYLFRAAPSGPPEVSKVITLTHLGFSCRSLSHGLLTFLESRIPVRVKLFFQKRSNGKGVAHSTCLKSVRVDHFRCSRAENEAFVWEGWKKVSTKAESGKGEGRRPSPFYPPSRSLSPPPLLSVSPL